MKRFFTSPNRYPLHIFLFLVTVFTTMMAGAGLRWGKMFFMVDESVRLQLSDILDGATFSFSFLLFLTVHEFGHYFTAMYHRVKCSLPYYIPIFIPFVSMNIGSFGAVIRIREMPKSRRQYFDIGVAGPLAGFVVALGLVIVGLATLPPMESYVTEIHPQYLQAFPTEADVANSNTEAVGTNLLMEGLKWMFSGAAADFPPAFELMHYPLLFAGFLGLFFTALNLLPIGQLDGGHVIYGLFGARVAGIISRLAVVCLLVVGGSGLLPLTEVAPEYRTFQDYWMWEIIKYVAYGSFLFYVFKRLLPEAGLRVWSGALLGTLGIQFLVVFLLPGIQANVLWLLYAFLAVTMIGVDHPEAPDDRPLSTLQKVLGALAILIFVACFTVSPLYYL